MIDDAIIAALEVLSDGKQPFSVVSFNGGFHYYGVAKTGTTSIMGVFATREEAVSYCRTMNYGAYLKNHG